jgi:thiol:disulfide interchange protein DsbD
MSHCLGIAKCIIGGSLLLALLLVAPAQGQTRLNVVAWSGKLEPGQVKPGERAKLLVTAKIDPGWHVYALNQPPGGPKATRIALEEGSSFTIDGNPQQPKPTTKLDPNFNIDTHTFAGEVTFTVPIRVAASAAPGAQKLIAKVTFMACDDHQCLPPRTRPVEVEATIVAGTVKSSEAKGAAAQVTPSPGKQPTPKAAPASTPTSDASPSPTATATPAAAGIGSGDGQAGNPSALALPPNTSSPAQAPPALKWKSSGLLGYIWFAMGFGLIALLTPCVFPMIPITVSFFTKREHQSHWAAVKQATVYCLGIIFTFTGLGLALTLVAGPAGINKVAANPWMNLFLVALFVVFALNLFGMFEIRIPSRWLSKLDARAGTGTMAATLLMGLTFTLTSFTCTAAFVGTVLVTATRGEWFWSAVGMLAFSTAFALPFFLLALFPQYLRSLPSSGGWLNSVKVVMGFLELAAAFKFLSNADLVWGWNTVSRHLVLAGWIAIAIVTAIYLLGKFQLPHDTPVERLGVARMLMSTFFLGLAFYLLAGLFGARMGELDAFLPPASVGAANSAAAATTPGITAEGWLSSYEEAIQRARAARKPVFLNFTGVTCTNCRWMETNIFTDPQVKKELERFVLAELFTDRQTPEDERNSELQEKNFGTVALPLYAVVAPDGEKLALFEGLTRDKNQFITFLQSGADRFEQLAARR